MLAHFRGFPHRVDHLLIAILGMGRHEADAFEPVHVVQAPEQPAEGKIVRGFAAIGVHVLAQERDLAKPLGHRALHLVHDEFARLAPLGSARVGHDAEGAEIIAPTRDAHEGVQAAPALDRREFGEIRRDRRGIHHAPLLHLLQKHRELGDVLCSENEIDHFSALCNRLPVARGETAADADFERRVRFLELIKTPDLAINLLLRLVADGAGVQQNQIGRLVRFGFLVPFRLEMPGDGLRIVAVHLAAVCENLELLAQGALSIICSTRIFGDAVSQGIP